MSTAERLADLARRKAVLRARIAERRAECERAAADLVRPLAIADKGLALWRATPEPVKALGLPVAALAAQKLAKHLPGVSVAKYVPLAMRGWRMFQDLRDRRRAAPGMPRPGDEPA